VRRSHYLLKLLWRLMKESPVPAHSVAMQHGGTLEVAIKPGAFACSTIVLPRAGQAQAEGALRRRHRMRYEGRVA